MGLGGYLASQAELDHFHYLRRHTAARVLRSCSGEMEREVHSILGPLGVNEALSRLVAEDLRRVEDDVWGDRAVGTEGVEGVVSASSIPNKDSNKSWFGKKNNEEEDGGQSPSEDMGLTAFLLKFGEGLGEYTCEMALTHRGGTQVPTIHLRPHHRSLLLYRRSHPIDPLYGDVYR